MNFKNFQKKINSDISNGVEKPYLFCFDGESVLLCNRGHSCIVSIPKEEVFIPLDTRYETKEVMRFKEPRKKPVNILPCFEGKVKYLFIDETNKQIFFDSKLISHFIDKKVKLSDYDLKYHKNVMYFYHDNVFVGCVLRLRSDSISLNYQELLEAEMKVQENRS